jgi:hypothetical protein
MLSAKGLFRVALIFAASIPALASAAMAASQATPDHIQSLIGETTAQFQLAYRLQPSEGEQRQAELNAVVAAWRSAAHNETNDQRLTTWMRAAIRTSMPGSREPLPPQPSFAVTKRVAKPLVEPSPAAVAPADTAIASPQPASKTETRTDESTSKPEAGSIDHWLVDPFQDDPIDPHAGASGKLPRDLKESNRK